MKTRHGFVSNSSSSSFIVIFPRRPKSQDEVQKILFPNGKEFLEDPYGDNTDDPATDIPATQVAETVWKDIQSQMPMHIEAIPEELVSGWFDEMPDMDAYDLWNREDGKSDENWKRFALDSERSAQVVSREFLDKHFDKDGENIIYRFSYSDNDGRFGCVMEHGGTFDALPHLTISHH